MANLTTRKIETLKPAATRREHPDGGGLYLVLQASGARSWAYRYRISGKPAKITLGAFPMLDLKAARTLAGEAAAAVARGVDPSAAKRARKIAAEPIRDTFEVVAAEYVDRYAKRHTRERSWREAERLLTRETTTWHGRRLSAITRADVGALLDKIADRGAAVVANRLLSALRRLGSWAVERGLVDVNPFAAIRAPSPEAARERVLSAGELRAAWLAFTVDQGAIGDMAKVLLLTGQRLREVAEMTWGEIDLEARAWTIPAARAKNGTTHEIPLSGATLEILAERKAAFPSCRFVFTANGRTAVTGFSGAKRRFDAAMAAELGAPLAGWTFHDLRRSFATNLAGLGVAPHVIEATINHRSGAIAGVARIYNRHGYALEKRAALDAWARELARITGAAPEPIEAERIAA